ncbi:MAG: hypothetical protein QOI91_2460 [Solirubrobacteraceae bacterium]|jgi:hypothetical protein|nr:hypothetical protein [Solirubrobacteraceae bacterium]
MRPTPTALVLAAVVGLLALAPAAWAETPLEQYQRTGKINPCTASGGPGSIPNDVAQYAPDFLDAYNAAQRQGCNRGGVSQTKPTDTQSGVPVGGNGQSLPPGSTFVPKPPAPPKLFHEGKVVRHLPLAAGADAMTPAPILGLAALLLLALVGGALAGTWRYMGWGLDRLDPLRHAAGEVRLRAASGLSGLADRLHLPGRRGT